MMEDHFTSTMMVIMSLLAFVIVIINLACIYVILSSSLLRNKTTTILIVSLLFFHFLQGFLVIPFYTAKKSRISNPPLKTIVCDGFRFSYMVTFYGVCINVLLISLDRCLAVRLLMSYRVIVTSKRVKIATFIMWVYIVCICFIPFVKTKSSRNSSCRYNQPREWTIFMLIGDTMFSYVVIACCYGYIYIKLNELEDKARLNSSEPITGQIETRKRTRESIYIADEGSKDESSRTIIKLTFVVVIIYGLTWTPSVIYYLIVSISPSVFPEDYYTSSEESYVTFFVKFVSFFDAIGAPVIYCYFHTDFRNEFKIVYKKWTARFGKRFIAEENGFVGERKHDEYNN